MMGKKKYRRVSLDGVSISERPFCIKCHCLCEHDDAIRSSTRKEREEYTSIGWGRDPSPSYLYVVHKKCENLPIQ